MFKKTEAKWGDNIIRKTNISPENWNVPKKKKKSGVNCRIEKYWIWNLKLNRWLWQQKTGLVKWKTGNFENSNLLSNAHRVKKGNTEESGNNICEQGEQICI